MYANSAAQFWRTLPAIPLLHATQAAACHRAYRRRPCLRRCRYANADELLADLRTLEDALIDGGADDLAKDLVRPVRWSVEIFRFRTVRLDLREKHHASDPNVAGTLAGKCWPERRHPARPASAAWKKWIIAELARPFPATRARLELPPEAQETLGMFELASGQAKEFDREAFGCFILSMTRSVADVLGAYLLAKARGSLSRRGGCRRPHLADRAIVRDDRRFACCSRHHARTFVDAGRPPQRPAPKAVCRK